MIYEQSSEYVFCEIRFSILTYKLYAVSVQNSTAKP